MIKTADNFYRSSILSKMSPQNNPLRNTTRLYPFSNKNTPSQALQADKEIMKRIDAPQKKTVDHHSEFSCLYAPN